MGNKFWTIVNWIVLVIVTLVAIWMVWDFPQNGSGEEVFSEECLDVGKLEGFRYEACYDAYSETIFLKASRDEDNYHVGGLSVSFVDLASQFYDLDEVPGPGDSVAYKLLAKKNPGNIEIVLNIAGSSSESFCGGRSVFVDYCPVGTGGGEGVDVSISPIDGVGIKDFIDVQDFPGVDSDVVVMGLAEKEAVWKSVCKSNWKCGEWEVCVDGVQRRDCEDLNSCVIPTDSSAGARNCDGACVENWECEWSGCEDGFSVPSCRDLNNCGTPYNIPEKLACEKRGECVPDVVCGDWAVCDVNYNFIDLVGVDRVTQLNGVKNRVCIDKKGCVSTQREEENCSINVDIYTERFERCGKEYVGVYDVLDDSTLAVLSEGVGDRPYLNIYFDDRDGVRCDYCFDGKMNGDEEGVDCGGSCGSCDGDVYIEKHWWDFLF